MTFKPAPAHPFVVDRRVLRRRWLRPLIVVGVALTVGLLSFSEMMRLRSPDSAEGPVPFGVLGLLVLASVFTLVIAGLFLFVGLVGVASAALHDRGVFAPWEKKRVQQHRDWLAHCAVVDAKAGEYRDGLVRREVPPVLGFVDVGLEPGEAPFMDVPLGYARFYGTDAVWNEHSMFAFGSLPFVAGALIVNDIGNRSARAQAIRAAAPMWREGQVSRVLVTNSRVLCLVEHGRWLSFWFSGIARIDYEHTLRRAVFHFHGDAEPLLLEGADITPLVVFAVFTVFGEQGLEQHPALHWLDDEPALAHGYASADGPNQVTGRTS